MWNGGIIIFEGEDEEALKSDFIRLCALHPKQDIFTIALYVFKGLPDITMRSQQAALVWSNDIEVQERIRQARLGASDAPQLLTKEQRIARLQAIADDEGIAAKDRIAAHALIAELNGERIKSVDKKVERVKQALPQVIMTQYTDDE